MKLEAFKRGDSFILLVEYREDAVTPNVLVPVNITGRTMRARLKDCVGEVVSDLVISLLTQANTTLGKFYVKAGPTLTRTWPVEDTRLDIECLDPDGTVGSSITLTLPVEEDFA